MATMFALGSQGPGVYDLQAKLNCHGSQLKQLIVDGIFGNKTLGRVQEFQKCKGLTADGIVGPLTQSKLNESLQYPTSAHQQCANCLPENGVHVASVRNLFTPLLGKPGNSFRSQLSFTQRSNAAPQATVGGIQIAALDKDQRDVAKARFGTSLNLDTIFITNKTGAGNRPFTVGIPGTSGQGPTVILNMGTLQPFGDDLVHELAHAWHAQHHMLVVNFMDNSIKSQAAALAINAPIGLFDATVRAHKKFPSLYPYSPYAYEPGKAFGDYGAEQIAQQVQHNVSAIVNHVKSVTAGKHDASNATSLSTPRIEDRRKATVK
jgi:peptidoglycan hydrolase-like protein with peptidoglycan-binding domain